MNLDIIASLQTTFGMLYDENFKPRDKVVYNKKIADFNKELEEVGISSKLTPKEIELKLQQIHELLEKKQEPLTKTTLNKDESEQFIKEAEQREANIKETREGQTKAVEDFIKRNQEQIANAKIVQEELEKTSEAKKTIYAKVTDYEVPVLSQDEQFKFDKIKEFAEANPKEFVKDLAKDIEEKLNPVLKTHIPAEDLRLLAEQTALEIVERAREPEISYQQTIILPALSKNIQTIAPKIVSLKAHQEILIQEINNLAKTREAIIDAPRYVTEIIFGKDITETLFGKKYGEKDQPKVEVSEKPFEEAIPIPVVSLLKQNIEILEIQKTFYVEILKSQIIRTPATEHQREDFIQSTGVYIPQTREHSAAVQQIKDIGVSEAKKFVYKRSASFIEQRMASLGEGHLKTFYSSPVTRSLLARWGMANPVTWEATGALGKFAIGSGYEPLIHLATGTKFVTPVINQTTAKVTGQVVGKAVGQVATEVAVGTAAKTGIAASLSATFAALGSWATPVGMAISAAIGWVIGKVLEKINWPKVKKWFQENGPVLAGIAGLGALALGGPAVGGIVLLGGLAATGTLGAFAMGAFGVFGFIGRSIGIAIATPVIVTLLVLPPLVAFIMLVINNSAYVIPPKPVAESGFGPGESGFSCTQEKTPTTITSSINSPIATRAWEIMEDMYQGFWCYWNRSPGDLATDITTHPPSYPELFNERLFAVKPNPTRDEVSNCGECLFWCTWLVQKSYKENGVSILYTLWSPSMLDDFKSRGKLKTGNEMTFSNIQSGAVIFFDIKNSLNRIDHVGVVHSISAAGVTFLQSNAGTKDDFIPFGTNGVLQNPSYATIGGIGNP